jgi:hypothetical protein
MAVSRLSKSRDLTDSAQEFRDLNKMPSSGIIRYAQDDMSMRLRPSYYVDYFSHDWSYETIQRSWRYIVSHTNEFDNAARLVNASLRICMKLLNKLKTIPPEALNW